MLLLVVLCLVFSFCLFCFFVFYLFVFFCFFFFFQAEDGIRDTSVTGVQTCALPISSPWRRRPPGSSGRCGRGSGWDRRRCGAGSRPPACPGCHGPPAASPCGSPCCASARSAGPRRGSPPQIGRAHV